MKETIKNYWSQFKTGTKTMFKEFFNKETNKKQRANMWSFSRLILIIPILICSISAITTAAPSLLIANSLLIIISEITDIFDGRSARKHKSTSDFGKLLDQSVDKIFSTIVAITLTLINPLCLLLLLGESIIVGSTVPYKMKYKNITDTSTFIGKVKQFPLSFSFVVGYLSPINSVWHTISTISIIVTLLFQITTALSYLKRNEEWVKEFKSKENNNDLIDIEEDFEINKEKEKTKTLENNGNNIIDKNITVVENNMSRTERIQVLRNWSNEISMTKSSNNQIDEVSSKEKVFQKTKK